MKRVLAALVPAVLALAAGACSGSHADRPVIPGSTAPPDLRVHRGDFHGRAVLTGELRAVHAENITVPRVPGYQTSIRWMEADGSVVAAGQKVVEFDNSAFVSDLEDKKLALTQATTDFEQKKAEVAGTLGQKEFELAQRHVALEKARTDAEVPEAILMRREYQERQLALEKARVEHEKGVEDLDAARKSSDEDLTQRQIAIDKAKREIGAAESAIGALVQTAPRAGILVVSNFWDGRKLQIGDPAWVGMTVMQIPDLAEMEVAAGLSDVDDGMVQAGMPATCTIDAYPEAAIHGVVKEVSPIAVAPHDSPARRVFAVVVSLDRSDPEKMRPGMSVKVEVDTGARKNVLLASRVALTLDSEPPRARLESGEEREVRLGPCGPLECVVEKGLAEGDRLGKRG
jgi:multidrug resistance efflux pump